MTQRLNNRVRIVAAVVIVTACAGSGGGLFGRSQALAAPDVQGEGKTSAPNTLPPIPGNLPNHFAYGLFNGDISDMHVGVPYDYRYQYLAGGVNTGDGWRTWNSDGL